MTSGYPDPSGHDELPLGVQIPQAVDLCVSTEVWGRMLDLALGVPGMVFLNDGVEEVRVARVLVGGWVTGVDTHITLGV